MKTSKTNSEPKPQKKTVSAKKSAAKTAPAAPTVAAVEPPSRSTKPAAKAKSRKPEAAAPKLAANPVTTVEAKIDVGFGNRLFIRGSGNGLSWEQGIPLECQEPAKWVWSTNGAQDRLAFKLLINDQIWSRGENFEIEAGERIEAVPSF